MTLYATVGPDGLIQTVGSMPDHMPLLPSFLQVTQAEYDRVVAGGRFRYTGTELVDIGPEPDAAARLRDRLERNVRQRRSLLLTECDWTQVSDNPLSPEQREAWRVYRVALRDLPAQADFPRKVEWPDKPA